MPLLRVSVLGPPKVHHGDARVVLSSAKATALLLYLAVTGEAHPRSSLAGLLWGGLPEDRARANLRLVLMRLRQEVGDHVRATPRAAELDRATVTDYRQFTEALESAEADLDAVRAAVALYRGAFLDGLVVRDAVEFENWVEPKRVRLQRLAVAGLERLAVDAEQRHAHDEVTALARRLLELDPFAEHAHRLVMSSLASAGRRAAALTQYETCRHVLADELGVAPEQATQQLARRIRETGVTAVAPADVDGALGTRDLRRPDQPRWELPVAGTPLVGREPELARLETLLRDPDCHLITLVGPGGVGKTRLAVAAAARTASAFADGVCYVALAGVHPRPGTDATDAITARILEAVGLPLTDGRPTAELLVSHFAGRHILLVLDNVEHLPLAGITGELLARCAGVTLLATSRRRIGLSAEWIVEVGGLPYPRELEDPTAEHAAVALFEQRARRVRDGFRAGDDSAAVARICRLVEGLPLAVELAADWMRVLVPAAIAARLQTAMDLLVTDAPVVAERHRSMRSVLEASWGLLDTDQQRALACLSVFRGSFDADAATTVADASLAVISALVEHSLVRRDPDGRLGLHELVRQFAVEQLAADRDAERAARSRHAHHYTVMLRQRVDDDASSAADAEPDLENFAAAWEVTVRAGESEAVSQLLEDLWPLYKRTGHFAAAVAALDQALGRSDVTVEHRARWHRWAGMAFHELGREQASGEHLRAALSLLGHPVPETTVGQLAGIAAAASRQVIRRLSLGRRPDTRRASRCTVEAAQVLSALAQGDYLLKGDASILWTLLAVADLGERSGEPDLVADAHVTLEGLTAAFGWHRLARRYRALGDRAFAAAGGAPSVVALETRGYILLGIGEWEAATAALTQARDLAQRSGQRRHWAECFAMLAFVDRFRGHLEKATATSAAVAAAARAWGDWLTLHWSLVGEARARLRAPLVDLEPVAELLEEDARLWDRLPTVDQALGVSVRGRLRLLEHRPTDAAADARHALMLLENIAVTGIRGLEAFTDVSEILLALWADGFEARGTGEVDAAARRAVRCLHRLANRVPVAEPGSWWAQGRLAQLEGRHRTAARAYERSRDAAARRDMPIEELRARRSLASCASHPARSGPSMSSA